MNLSCSKTFNENKHARGDWNTRIVVTSNAFVRACIGFVSAKRRGVDNLATVTAFGDSVLDAGAGNCAYSVWFASKATNWVISVDMSYNALKSFAQFKNSNLLKGKISRVCADIQALPFKEKIFKTVFTIDTLGHVQNVNKVLDEINRCTQKGALLFCHSECADYTSAWPDNMLIKKLSKDIPRCIDGHTGAYRAKDLFQMYSRRFRITSFTNPRGYFGWVLGYPEKYAPAFAASHNQTTALFLRVMAKLKKTPIFGGVIRYVNACTNHAEIFFGLTGGGSCFADLKKDD